MWFCNDPNISLHVFIFSMLINNKLKRYPIDLNKIKLHITKVHKRKYWKYLLYN